MFKKRQFLHSVKWVLVSNWGREGILSLVTFILAAILGPTDFGTVAIAYIYIAFVQMFVGLGFNATLIQKKDLNESHLDSVFWLVVILSLLLMAISIALSGWWANINHSVQIKAVICSLSVLIPIQGLIIVQQALFHRKMDFKSLALRDNVSAFAGGVIGISMALWGFGVWALVGQQLSRALLSLLLLWKLSDWRPSFKFSPSHAKETLNFSFKVFVGRIGDYFQGYSDALLLGVFLGPQAVGLYRLATRIMRIPVALVSRAIHVVSLPQFSQFQDNTIELKNTLLFCLRGSTIITIPVVMGLSGASDLVMAVIGPKWLPASKVLMILCIVGFVMSMTLFTGTLLQAIGKPGIQTTMTWCLAITNAVFFVAVGILFRKSSITEQIVLFAASRALVYTVFLPVNLFIASRYTGITLNDILRNVGPSVVTGSLIFLGIILLKSVNVFELTSPIFALAFAVGFSFLLWIGATLLLDRQIRQQVFGVLSKSSF